MFGVASGARRFWRPSRRQSLRSAMLLRRDSQHRDHGGDDVGVVPSHRRIPR
nr:TPA_asm: m68.7-m73.5 ORF [Murid betaherpesvirus 1]DBA07804.1 TPA_asm: m68.7-m73.5 ORF [Murid betaherpesvirus 1]